MKFNMLEEQSAAHIKSTQETLKEILDASLEDIGAMRLLVKALNNSLNLTEGIQKHSQREVTSAINQLHEAIEELFDDTDF